MTPEQKWKQSCAPTSSSAVYAGVCMHLESQYCYLQLIESDLTDLLDCAEIALYICLQEQPQNSVLQS